MNRWRKKHPEARSADYHRRRARLRGIEDNFTRQEWKDVLTEHGGRCAYCAEIQPLEMEHIDPISKGGQHQRENIVAACGGCNNSKQAQSLIVWLARRAAA